MTAENQTPFARRLAALMEECLGQLSALNIETSHAIEGIRENSRAKKRLGCCKLVREGGRSAFVIEISSMLEGCSDKVIKDVIFHELLHTCPGCLNHGPVWKALAQRVNRAWGTDIRVRIDTEYIPGMVKEQEAERAYKYEIRCQGCGRSVYRMRRSRIVDHPENYRCGSCGGALRVIRL